MPPTVPEHAGVFNTEPGLYIADGTVAIHDPGKLMLGDVVLIVVLPV